VCSKLEQEFADSWSLLRGHGSVDCVRVYLMVVRKWSYFGARTFPARVSKVVEISCGIILLKFRQWFACVWL